MRRMLFNLAVGFSFVLLIALCFTWIRSSWAYDRVTIGDMPFNREVTLTLVSGRFIAVRFYAAGLMSDKPSAWNYFADADYVDDGLWPRPEVMRSFLSFSFLQWERTTTQGLTYGWWVIVLPLWFFALVLSLLPSYWLLKRSRRQRRLLRAARGYCPACGADLRLRYGEKCPACGQGRWVTQ